MAQVSILKIDSGKLKIINGTSGNDDGKFSSLTCSSTTGTGLTVSSTDNAALSSSGGISLGAGNFTVATNGAMVVKGTSTLSGGTVDLSGAAGSTTVTLKDNQATALTFDATGKTGILKLVSTDAGEGVDMSGTLAVTGASTLSSTLTVTGAGEFDSSLGADGDFRVGSAGASNFTVTASNGNSSVGGTLAVTGAATLSSTLAVTGAATLSSTLTVTGAGEFDSSLGADGDFRVGSAGASNFKVTASSGKAEGTELVATSNGTNAVYLASKSNWLGLNSQYTTDASRAGGVVSIHDPAATGYNIQSITASVASPAADGKIVLGLGEAANFAAGDIVLVDGVSAVADEGLFEVQAAVGTDLTVKTAANAPSETFMHATIGAQAGVGGTVRKVQISALRSTASGWEEVGGDSAPLSWKSVASADSITKSFTVATGQTIAAGDLVAAHTVAGEITEADASVEQTARVVGFATQAASAGAACEVLIAGSRTTVSGGGALTIGTPVYASAIAGEVTSTAPSVSGDWIVELGIAVGANEVLWQPKAPVQVA